MKKTATLLFFVCSISLSIAQVQRVRPAAKSADSSSAETETKKATAADSRKDMMKELNLTKEQKIKLREIKQEGKAKQDEVMNDEKLAADEKKTKLKALRMEQFKNILAVLNDEQKTRMRQMKMQRQKEGKNDMEMEDQ